MHPGPRDIFSECLNQLARLAAGLISRCQSGQSDSSIARMRADPRWDHGAGHCEKVQASVGSRLFVWPAPAQLCSKFLAIVVGRVAKNFAASRIPHCYIHQVIQQTKTRKVSPIHSNLNF